MRLVWLVCAAASTLSLRVGGNCAGAKSNAKRARARYRAGQARGSKHLIQRRSRGSRSSVALASGDLGLALLGLPLLLDGLDEAEAGERSVLLRLDRMSLAHDHLIHAVLGLSAELLRAEEREADGLREGCERVVDAQDLVHGEDGHEEEPDHHLRLVVQHEGVGVIGERAVRVAEQVVGCRSDEGGLDGDARALEHWRRHESPLRRHAREAEPVGDDASAAAGDAARKQRERARAVRCQHVVRLHGLIGPPARDRVPEGERVDVTEQQLH
mmetsp:Transcript_24770/g.58863  ORF Transcript_24770/g.58863 Transcript_24770/m.58863 type:complete len:271 (-) Transcript_24770:477-1289(-)